MQKVFQEYGGVITTAMAIVALIGLLGLFFTSDGNGWMDNAFKDVIEGFGDKVEEAVPGEGGDTDGPTTMAAGLYDANDELVASWDELVNTYGMDVETNYTRSTYKTAASSPYVVLNKSALSSGAKLVIDDSVAGIGDYAFRSCTSLTGVIIPDGVTSIGDSAFPQCTNLTNVTFGENSRLTGIGEFAFSGCTSLTSITIPDGVTSIGGWAFDGCTSLTTVDIPGSVTALEMQAFSHCTSLASVTVGDGVITIGRSAFLECTNLVSFTIPDSVTEIDSNAFYECTSLNSITFEGTVKQWNAIAKLANWNYGCGAITVTCTDGTVTVPANNG